MEETATLRCPATLNEFMKLLLEPDVLASVRYLATLQSKTRVEPEKKLMRAVLEDAICCFQNYLLARDSRGKKVFCSALEWIFDTNNEYIFSFANICETLNLDPSYLRKGLLRSKALKLRRRRAGRNGSPKLKVYSHELTVH